MAGLTTERLKYTGTVNMLPKGAVYILRLTRSASLLKLRRELFCAALPSHSNRSWFANPRFVPQLVRVLSYSHEGGRKDHTVYALGWLDAASRSTATKECLICLAAVLSNYGIHMIITQLQQCTDLHFHMRNI
jgi:hypothetical protein